VGYISPKLEEAVGSFVVENFGNSKAGQRKKLPPTENFLAAKKCL